MDEIPNPHQADDIARAYLKQLRQKRRLTSENVQKPGLKVWRELEERLMLGPLSNETTEPKVVKLATRKTSTTKEAKKAQSIWNRPISELWRRQGV